MFLRNKKRRRPFPGTHAKLICTWNVTFDTCLVRYGCLLQDSLVPLEPFAHLLHEVSRAHTAFMHVMLANVMKIFHTATVVCCVPKNFIRWSSDEKSKGVITIWYCTCEMSRNNNPAVNWRPGYRDWTRRSDKSGHRYMMVAYQLCSMYNVYVM